MIISIDKFKTLYKINYTLGNETTTIYATRYTKLGNDTIILSSFYTEHFAHKNAIMLEGHAESLEINAPYTILQLLPKKDMEE